VFYELEHCRHCGRQGWIGLIGPKELPMLSEELLCPECVRPLREAEARAREEAIRREAEAARAAAAARRERERREERLAVLRPLNRERVAADLQATLEGRHTDFSLNVHITDFASEVVEYRDDSSPDRLVGGWDMIRRTVLTPRAARRLVEALGFEGAVDLLASPLAPGRRVKFMCPSGRHFAVPHRGTVEGADGDGYLTVAADLPPECRRVAADRVEVIL